MLILSLLLRKPSALSTISIENKLLKQPRTTTNNHSNIVTEDGLKQFNYIGISVKREMSKKTRIRL